MASHIVNDTSATNNVSAFVPPLLFILLLTGIASQLSPLRHGQNALDHHEYTSALAWLQPLADKGNPQAQLDLGLMYEHGWGVKKDTPTAVKWLQEAMDGKDATARKDLRALEENPENPPGIARNP